MVGLEPIKNDAREMFLGEDTKKIVEGTLHLYIVFLWTPGDLSDADTRLTVPSKPITTEMITNIIDRMNLRKAAGLFRPRGYTTFSMLNSAKHEIYPAHKY